MNILASSLKVTALKASFVLLLMVANVSVGDAQQAESASASKSLRSDLTRVVNLPKGVAQTTVSGASGAVREVPPSVATHGRKAVGALEAIASENELQDRHPTPHIPLPRVLPGAVNSAGLIIPFLKSEVEEIWGGGVNRLKQSGKQAKELIDEATESVKDLLTLCVINAGDDIRLDFNLPLGANPGDHLESFWISVRCPRGIRYRLATSMDPGATVRVVRNSSYQVEIVDSYDRHPAVDAFVLLLLDGTPIAQREYAGNGEKQWYQISAVLLQQAGSANGPQYAGTVRPVSRAMLYAHESGISVRERELSQ